MSGEQASLSRPGHGVHCANCGEGRWQQAVAGYWFCHGCGATWRGIGKTFIRSDVDGPNHDDLEGYALMTHYVVEITIKSVTRPTPGPTAGRVAPLTVPAERVVDDVTRVVLKGDSLNEALTKAQKHLALELEPTGVEYSEDREKLESEFRDAVAKKPAEWRE